MDVKDHEIKFDRAERLINESIMDADTTSHVDWLITVMYYSAYHLIHKHCAARKKPCHPTGHGQTVNEARRLKRGFKIHGDVQFLSDECFNARYEPTEYSKDDVQTLKRAYENIKNILA